MKSLFARALIATVAIAGGAPGMKREPGARVSGSAQRSRAANRDQSDASRSISGRVVDEGSQPIAGAAVFVLRAGLANRRSEAEMFRSVRPTSTDESGKFAANVGPGAYIVRVVAPGYTSIDNQSHPHQQSYYRPGESATIKLVKGGVITGTVTSAAGEPLIAVPIRATRVRDLEGRRPTQTGMSFFDQWKTDDRGVYRIYGLAPGVYVVSAGGKGFLPMLAGPYAIDAPTFYPSATRDTATEVTVRAAEEATGIDIRYREGSGHAISGTILGSPAAATDSGDLSAILLHGSSRSIEGTSPSEKREDGGRSFQFDGVSDGEYFVTAVGGIANNKPFSSQPRRVTVKGADVTGVELVLAPLGSIAGRVVLEPLPPSQTRPECRAKRGVTVEEIALFARSVQKSIDPVAVQSLFELDGGGLLDSSPDDKGEFVVGYLANGRYQLVVNLPSEAWFVRSIRLTDAATQPGSNAAKRIDPTRAGIAINSGSRVEGVTITIAEGAAGVRGRVVPAQTVEGEEKRPLPPRLRVYIVPAEPQSTDDVVRYYQTGMAADGSFSFASLAPGRYWLVARPGSGEEPGVEERPVAWDATGRAQLRIEAAAAGTSIELQNCQRLSEQILRYPNVKHTSR